VSDLEDAKRDDDRCQASAVGAGAVTVSQVGWR